MPIKLKDIAKIANVSPATASLALNGSNLVKAETREMIKKIAKENGYFPNAMAKALAKRKSNTIGLIIPDIEDTYYGKLVRYIDQNVSKAGYNLILAISNDKSEIEKKIIQNFIFKGVEGIIIAPVNDTNLETEYLENLKKCHIPHIFVTAHYPMFDSPYVMVDLEQGSYDLVKYLLSIGRKDIYFLVGPRQEVISSQYRVDGYIKAHREIGLDIDKSRIIGCSRYDYEKAYEATEKIIKSNKNIDAIITINDTMALAAVNAIKAHGLSVPEDISVAGYDDMPFSTISTVPITTVKQDVLKISEIATEILIKKINDECVEI
jgi:DNA-binding LacI/PurR family transcriptional regulator